MSHKPYRDPEEGKVLDKSGGKVRLRGTAHPELCSVDIEGKGKIEVTLRPNQWVDVPPEIYDVLVRKFSSPRYVNVPDMKANEDHPHAPGETPAMRQEVTNEQYIMEFR